MDRVRCDIGFRTEPEDVMETIRRLAIHLLGGVPIEQDDTTRALTAEEAEAIPIRYLPMPFPPGSRHGPRPGGY
jgi:hypothetical protein